MIIFPQAFRAHIELADSLAQLDQQAKLMARSGWKKVGPVYHKTTLLGEVVACLMINDYAEIQVQ